MLPKLLISPSLEKQISAAEAELAVLNVAGNHPDLLKIDSKEENLGMAAVKKVIEHFRLKPYQAKGKIVVILGVQELTQEAQNALLKTLEEPPADAVLIFTADSESNLISTFLSRCQKIYISGKKKEDYEGYLSIVERFFSSSLEENFQTIEKEENKEDLLFALVFYVNNSLSKDFRLVEFAKDLIKAQEWQKSNVNTRAILEYLMIRLDRLNQGSKN